MTTFAATATAMVIAAAAPSDGSALSGGLKGCSSDSVPAGEVAADDELAGGAQDAEGAPGHVELAVVDQRTALDLVTVARWRDRRVCLDQHLLAGGLERATHLQRVAFELGVIGFEADLRMGLDVEEIVRTRRCLSRCLFFVSRLSASITRATAGRPDRSSVPL